MGAKYIAGDFPEVTKINAFLGQLTLFCGANESDQIDLIKNLKSVDILTEENKDSFLGKAGWGAVGAIALGPIGLLAGALSGGKSKEVTVACELIDSRKFIAVVDPGVYQQMLKISFGNKSKTPHDLQLEQEEADRKVREAEIEKQNRIPIYKKIWFVWLMILFVFPAGIYLLWKDNHYSKGVRIGITVCILGIVLNKYV